MKDKTRSIPFLGLLSGLAFVGHNVLVFEGHSSALAAAVKEANVLMIDSGMLPFLQADWAEVVFGAMPTGSRVRIFDRKTGVLNPVIQTKTPPGWKLPDPAGEGSYVSALLTVLAKRPPIAFRITAGLPVPDPTEPAGGAASPFNFDRLDAAKVIAILRQVAKLGTAESGQMRVKLATGAAQLDEITFALRVDRDAAGREQLHLQKI